MRLTGKWTRREEHRIMELEIELMKIVGAIREGEKKKERDGEKWSTLVTSNRGSH